MTQADLPARGLLESQSARLAGMRSRLLRRAGIAHRRRVLDLGAGPGVVTSELRRRAGGPVVALDRRREALGRAGAPAVSGDATALPFRDGSFDLVLAQLVLLWVRAPDEALSEAYRVLRPGGVLLAIEPDFGGLMEDPPAVALGPIWRAALTRAGADPLAGRRLPARARRAGFEVTVDLLPGLAPPEPDRFALLSELPLEADEWARLEAARAAERSLGPGEKTAHLPFFFVSATRPRR